MTHRGFQKHFSVHQDLPEKTNKRIFCRGNRSASAKTLLYLLLCHVHIEQVVPRNIFHLIWAYPVSANITKSPPKKTTVRDWKMLNILDQNPMYINRTDVSQPNLFLTSSFMNCRFSKAYLPTDTYSTFDRVLWLEVF